MIGFILLLLRAWGRFALPSLLLHTPCNPLDMCYNETMRHSRQDLFNCLSFLSTTPVAIKTIAKDMEVTEDTIVSYMSNLRQAGWTIVCDNNTISIGCQQLTLLQDYFGLCENGNLQYDLSPESLIAQLVRMRR